MHKEYAVGALLDNEVAFNNARTEKIVCALDKFDVEMNLNHLVYCLLFSVGVHYERSIVAPRGAGSISYTMDLR